MHEDGTSLTFLATAEEAVKQMPSDIACWMERGMRSHSATFTNLLVALGVTGASMIAVAEAVTESRRMTHHQTELTYLATEERKWQIQGVLVRMCLYVGGHGVCVGGGGLAVCGEGLVFGG